MTNLYETLEGTVSQKNIEESAHKLTPQKSLKPGKGKSRKAKEVETEQVLEFDERTNLKKESIGSFFDPYMLGKEEKKEKKDSTMIELCDDIEADIYDDYDQEDASNPETGGLKVPDFESA